MAKTDTTNGDRPKRAQPGADGLLDGALRCFYRYGYAGTSVRQIAAAADVSVAALYHHFGSKQDMLVVIMRRAMESALQDAQAAYAAAGPDPVEQLKAVVVAMVRYHARHQAEAFVGNSELRSLERPSRSEIIALRDAHEAIVRQVIRDGRKSGVFQVDEPDRAARAVIAMCVAVASWYQRSGSLSPEDVAELYSQYALNLVGFTAKPVRRAAARSKG